MEVMTRTHLRAVFGDCAIHFLQAETRTRLLVDTMEGSASGRAAGPDALPSVALGSRKSWAHDAVGAGPPSSMV